MGRIRGSLRLLLLAALLAAAAPLRAAAPGPQEVIRASNQAVLALLRQHPTVDDATERSLFALIDPVTDFAGMAEAATGSFCAKLTAAECSLFRETFTRLLRVSSIKKLGRYRADSFDYLGEERTAGTAVVRTLAHHKAEKVPLDYQLALRGERWLIVNYVVDEVDTIRNYRKQFTRLFQQESFAQVIDRLRAKIASYEAER